MVTVNQVVNQFQQQFILLIKQVSDFFFFVFNKIKNFTHLTLAEQIAYGLIGVGLALALTSIVLFIL